MNCLDSFQSGFSPGYGTKMVFSTLLNDIHQEMGKGACDPINSPDLSVAVNTINYGNILDNLLGF